MQVDRRRRVVVTQHLFTITILNFNNTQSPPAFSSIIFFNIKLSFRRTDFVVADTRFFISDVNGSLLLSSVYSIYCIAAILLWLLFTRNSITAIHYRQHGRRVTTMTHRRLFYYTSIRIPARGETGSRGTHTHAVIVVVVPFVLSLDLRLSPFPPQLPVGRLFLFLLRRHACYPLYIRLRADDDCGPGEGAHAGGGAATERRALRAQSASRP